MSFKRIVPFLTGDNGKDLSLIILLIPLWWLLGFRFFVFHLAAMIGFIRVLRLRKREKAFDVPVEMSLLLAFVGLYMFSLVFNMGSIPFSRIIASINNLSYWVMGFLLIAVIRNTLEKEALLSVLRSCLIFGITSSVLVITAFSAGLLTQKKIFYKSLLMALLPAGWIETISLKAPLLRASLLVNIVGEDKLFGNPFPRSPGFNIYGTALGLTMVLMIAMTLAYFKVKKKKKGLAVVLSLETAALLLSLSRITVIGFLMALAAVSAAVHFKERRKTFLKAAPVVLILLIILLVLVPPQEIIDTFADFRKGSTLWRARLYNLTLEQALEKPVLGHGYKPRPEDFPVPIGSHSTFLGVFYKTGFLGILVFCGFWTGLLWRWWKLRRLFQGDSPLRPVWYYSGVSLVAGLIWMITEDLDAPPVAAFLFFIVAGVIYYLDRLKGSEQE